MSTVEPTFWSRVFGLLGLGGLQRTAGNQYPTPSGHSSQAARPVTWDTAMQVSACWACVRLLSETVAGLPITIYRVGNGTREIDLKHPLSILFGHKVNRYQTRVEFFETMMLNLTTWGNAYARIKRDGAGNVVSLLPMMSSQMVPTLLHDGAMVYEYQRDGGVEVLAESSVWHIKLFGNGVSGLSPLAYARNSLGIAQASEDRVSGTFRNGAKPSGILMVDAALTKAQRSEVRASFSDLAEGQDDSLIVLDKFMKYEQVSMSPQDIELLNSRRFQMEDIARFFGVPSVLINDTHGSTTWGSGVQQIIEGFYKLNLRPYLERIEASARAHLMTPEDRRSHELEFDFDGLLRMDQDSRFKAYQSAIQTAQMTPNEARALEGRAPLDGGSQLYIQGAMVPVSQAGQPRNPTQVQ
jgi:HK97 family phage portal protein